LKNPDFCEVQDSVFLCHDLSTYPQPLRTIRFYFII